MKPSLGIVTLCAIVIACGSSSSPQVVPEPQGVTVGQALDAMTAPSFTATLVHGDFTPEQWAAATAPRPQKNARASSDTRSHLEHLQAACGSPDGRWWCPAIPRPKTPMAFGGPTSPITPASWSVSEWDDDPANGAGCAVNTNTCTSQTCVGGCSGSACPSGEGPCADINEIITHRLGTTSPALQQPTTFRQMSAYVLNQHPYWFTPQLANGAQAIRLGTLTQVCTIPANTATIAAQVRGGPGTRWQISALCAGATAKMLLQDTTQNTWSTIDTVGPPATLSQPLPNSVLSTVGIPTLSEGSMASVDAFTVWAQPLANQKQWTPVGGDVGPGGANTAASVGWTQFVEIADSSGAGASQYTLSAETLGILSGVRLDTRLTVSSRSGRSISSGVIGCDVTGSTSMFSGSITFYGGIFRNGAAASLAGEWVVDGDAVVHTAFSLIAGRADIGNAFTDVNFIIGNGLARLNGFLWGSGSAIVDAGSTFWNNTGGTWAAHMLLLSGMSFAASTTGYTAPVCSTFTLNGVTQVNVAPPGGSHFPANAPISWSLATVGSTPGTASPYFSAATIADQFSVKSPTANANDVYSWCAQSAPLAITMANIDLYDGLLDPFSGAKATNQR